jgi:hypothetical protein
MRRTRVHPVRRNADVTVHASRQHGAGCPQCSPVAVIQQATFVRRTTSTVLLVSIQDYRVRYGTGVVCSSTGLVDTVEIRVECKLLLRTCTGSTSTNSQQYRLLVLVLLQVVTVVIAAR